MRVLLLQRATVLARTGTTSKVAASRIQPACSLNLPNQSKIVAKESVRSIQSPGLGRFSTKTTGSKNTVRPRASETDVTPDMGGGGGAAGGGVPGTGGDGEGESFSGKEGYQGLWGAYLSALEKNPVLTKSLTAALLNAVGDILSQTVFEKVDKFDFKRAGIFSLLGLTFVGPSLHFWYGGLAAKVTTPGIKGLFTRLALDQGVFAPIFIAIIFALLPTLEGHPEKVEAKIKSDLKGAVIANWKLWIPCQLVNFAFVPVHLQVLYANTFAIAWNTYLSYQGHKAPEPLLEE